jgi:hypothetical protein
VAHTGDATSHAPRRPRGGGSKHLPLAHLSRAHDDGYGSTPGPPRDLEQSFHRAIGRPALAEGRHPNTRPGPLGCGARRGRHHRGPQLADDRRSCHRVERPGCLAGQRRRGDPGNGRCEHPAWSAGGAGEGSHRPAHHRQLQQQTARARHPAGADGEVCVRALPPDADDGLCRGRRADPAGAGLAESAAGTRDRLCRRGRQPAIGADGANRGVGAYHDHRHRRPWHDGGTHTAAAERLARGSWATHTARTTASASRPVLATQHPPRRQDDRFL